MKQPRQWYGVAVQSGSAALQKRLHIHPPSEGLSPGCSHPGCRNYQNPSKGRGCLSQLSPLDPKDPQSHMIWGCHPRRAGSRRIWAGQVSSYGGPFIHRARVQLWESVSTNLQVWCIFAHARLRWLFRPRNSKNQEGKRVSAPSPSLESQHLPVSESLLLASAPCLSTCVTGSGLRMIPDVFSRNSWWYIFLLL